MARYDDVDCLIGEGVGGDRISDEKGSKQRREIRSRYDVESEF